jgi:predicted phage terminase large subunit-like protein
MLSLHEYNFVLRHDFMSFLERSFYELKPGARLHLGKYIEVMASKLEACRQGKIKRLIINLPPRHLKSHAASVAFVAWLLGHDPSLNIICVSYGKDLADDMARRCRTLMNSAFFKELFPTRLATDRQALDNFGTTANGSRIATSVGGVLTGRGADFIIIDDPLKPDEALSDTQRPAVNGWLDNTLLSRLDDKGKGCIIIVMQRLHQDDLVGHVMEQEKWDVVSFPAIAEEDESFLIENAFGKKLFIRRAGDLLDPSRESLVTLGNIRKSLGDYNFSAQYQQNPVPKGGNVIKTEWLRYCDPNSWPKHFTFTLLSLDTANKASELNNYSVGTIWGYYRDHFYLRHVMRKRLEYPDLKREVTALVKEFGVSKILIEDKASGTQLIQDLRRDGLLGIEAYEPPSNMDKHMRLRAQTTAFEEGRVILPLAAPWLDLFVKELTGFPGGKYSDQVDSTSQAMEYLKNKCSLAVWEKLGRG